MKPQVTMLDLVTAVSQDAHTEAEVIATVAYMVNSGHVRLRGNFRDCRFSLADLPAVARRAVAA